MPPNVVLIFTDNQQASTLGCYGNTEAHTPNIDALAATGVTFENAFCPNAYCSPCRASLMTGLMPSQHGVHSWLDDRIKSEWPKGWHTLNRFSTLPQRLKSAGYATALIGKYHLGELESPMPGFDHWVSMADGHVRSFYRNEINENGHHYHHEGPSVEFFTDKAVAFIEDRATHPDPFFLYLPYPSPYAHWPATKETDRNRHSDRFADCPMQSIPRQGLSKAAVDGFLKKNQNSGGGLDFSMLMRAPNDLATLRNYYAQISLVDDGVGRIVEALDRLGLSDDTLIIFTADHGISLGHHGFWGHGGATYPSNMHRAAHSVPLIARMGAGQKPGIRPAQMVQNLDAFATILEVAGLGAATPPQDRPDPIAARSFLPAMSGDTAALHTDDLIFAEQEETRVARSAKWLLFQRFKQGAGAGLQDELYDLEADPFETQDRAQDPKYQAIVQALSAKIDAYFATFSRAESNLWTGGQPIQNSESKDFWRAAWGADWAPVLAHPGNTGDATGEPRS